MSISRLMQKAAAGAGEEPLAVEDVFSTYLYEGNGSGQTITNGIDLENEGGLVWSKIRDDVGDHFLQHKTSHYLSTNTTTAETADNRLVTQFNSDGYDLGIFGGVNGNDDKMVSWTFRKAPGFFDVVAYDGKTSTGRSISHNLGVEPGFIMIKQTSGNENWAFLHKDSNYIKGPTGGDESDALTADVFGDGTNIIRPTASDFTVAFTGSDSYPVNDNDQSYVAYLFGHNPDPDGLIYCGTYIGNGSIDGPEIDIGWEPQFIIIHNIDGGGSWYMFDSMREFTAEGSNDGFLTFDTTDTEDNSADYIAPTPTGFKLTSNSNRINEPSYNFIYIAIRRGPMRPPESGTEVFAVDIPATGVADPTYFSGFPVDMALGNREFGDADEAHLVSRLTGTGRMSTNTTDAEVADGDFTWDYMDGYYQAPRGNSTFISWMFRRAPEFFDVVAYTGDGVSGRTVPHNLGVAPEMMIVKSRNSNDSWLIYHQALGPQNFLEFTSGSAQTSSFMFDDTSPTETVFTLGSNAKGNGLDNTYIAYLFATLPGVSKVGSYTGDGTASQTIDCGFSSGARFVLIKRTTTGSNYNGNWLVWDSERGIVAGNDPLLTLSSTASEITDEDFIDPHSSGFTILDNGTSGANVSSASYIFLAIA